MYGFSVDRKNLCYSMVRQSNQCVIICSDQSVKYIINLKCELPPVCCAKNKFYIYIYIY
jgi:hypothetical protein